LKSALLISLVHVIRIGYSFTADLNLNLIKAIKAIKNLTDCLEILNLNLKLCLKFVTDEQEMGLGSR